MNPMKRITSTSLILSFCILLSGQNVDILDSNFLEALIEEGVDLNQDGLIQKSEALMIEKLVIMQKDIESIKGIQDFQNLNWLNCSFNQIEDLDLENANLKTLVCSNNQLFNGIDLRKIPSLEFLNCSYNSISELDLTGLSMLTTLYCGGNELLNLDISKNLLLNFLSCGGNKLESLDLQNNTLLDVLFCEDSELNELLFVDNTPMSYLYLPNNSFECLDLSNVLEIDFLELSFNSELKFLLLNSIKIENLMLEGTDLNYICAPTEIWDVIDPIHTANTTITDKREDVNCDNLSVNIYEAGDVSLKIIPNPGINNLTITAPNHIHYVTIYGVSGQELMHYTCSSSNLELDISRLSSGMYFLKIEYFRGSQVMRFVKK